MLQCLPCFADVSELLKTGPYVYELFSVLVHSGGAAGGHYYAYIKDIASDTWFTFNDATVSCESPFSAIVCFLRKRCLYPCFE